MLAPMSNRRFSIGVALWLALLAPTSTALAWPTVEPEGHRVPLLGGRWTVALPENAVRAAAQTPPSAPPPREELDSATIVQTDEGNFGMRATLLESTRPEDLAAAVRGLPAPCTTPAYGTIGERTDLVAIRCTEPSPDGAFRPISVYAVHTDGWVDRIEALVETTNPDDTDGRTAGVAYAEAVMATLTASAAPDAVERGTIEVARACEQGEDADRITVTLPDGWIALRDAMPNGDLLRLTRVVPLGTGRAMLAIELASAGTQPPRVPEGVGEHQSGTLLGQTADWLVLHQEGSATSVRQVASEITIDCGGGSTFARTLRLSVGGPVDTVVEGQHVLETMALTTTRGHTVELAGISSEAPVEEAPDLEAMSDEDRATEEQGHFWSIAIGGASLLLLAAALVLRGRTTRPK
jgi:hypothetical protein